MDKIGLFYASSTGNTKDAAELISENLGVEHVSMHNVDGCNKDEIKGFKKLIIGISTWGEGDLQDDWEEYLPHMREVDFSDKTVAFFGLGDQDEYGDNFLDAMGTLYDLTIERGATVIGSWPTDGYDFDESTAVRDGEFVGLGLDEDNQFDLSKERITKWVEQIKPYFI